MHAKMSSLSFFAIRKDMQCSYSISLPWLSMSRLFWFLQIFATSRARLTQSTASCSVRNSLITAFRQGGRPGITQWAIWREQWPMHCNELWGMSHVPQDFTELPWQRSGKRSSYASIRLIAGDDHSDHGGKKLSHSQKHSLSRGILKLSMCHME